MNADAYVKKVAIVVVIVVIQQARVEVLVEDLSFCAIFSAIFFATRPV